MKELPKSFEFNKYCSLPCIQANYYFTDKLKRTNLFDSVRMDKLNSTYKELTEDNFISTADILINNFTTEINLFKQ
jgi:hypothetical protein